MSKAKNPGPIGRRLRELRETEGWTLADVNQKTGISKSTLSKIENGQTQLSFVTVNRLSEGLEIPITTLTAPESGKHLARRSVTRRGNGTEFETVGARYEVLCDDIRGNHQTFMRIHITARAGDESVDWRQHPGQEFVYVLSGTLELQTEAYEPTLLKPGDSILFDASMQHRYLSRGRKDAEILCTMQAQGYTDID
ncbi:MAG: XRE family transcriptional regulator [Pseudomonadota bacterium]